MKFNIYKSTSIVFLFLHYDSILKHVQFLVFLEYAFLSKKTTIIYKTLAIYFNTSGVIWRGVGGVFTPRYRKQNLINHFRDILVINASLKYAIIQKSLGRKDIFF